MATFRPICEASKIDRFGFDVELLYVGYLAGLRLREVPVRWDHNDGSKLNMFRDTFKAFDEIRTIRKLVKQGAYEHAVKRVKKALEDSAPGREISLASGLAGVQKSRDELVAANDRE
jgi:hypothetical protein